MDWKSILGTAAPIIGTLLGGPAGTAIGGLVAKALGVGETKGDLEAALSKDPKLVAKIKQLEIEQGTHLADLASQIQLAQISVNKAAAKSGNIWQAGARPLFLWAGGAAFAWQYVLAPMLNWIVALAGSDVVAPTLDLSVMMPVVLGLLGLGGMKTAEKIKGIRVTEADQTLETGILVPPKLPG